MATLVVRPQRPMGRKVAKNVQQEGAILPVVRRPVYPPFFGIKI